MLLDVNRMNTIVLVREISKRKNNVVSTELQIETDRITNVPYPDIYAKETTQSVTERL